MYKTKKQGNAGLGQAIAYFTSLGYVVSIPLNDSQKYDLIVDVNDCLQRVSVKTTSFSRHGNYNVLLKQAGGTRKLPKSTHFDNTKVDLVFIHCSNNQRYLFPASEIKAHSILSLYSKYNRFLV
jgi:hypothetical protein